VGQGASRQRKNQARNKNKACSGNGDRRLGAASAPTRLCSRCSAFVSATCRFLVASGDKTRSRPRFALGLVTAGLELEPIPKLELELRPELELELLALALELELELELELGPELERELKLELELELEAAGEPESAALWTSTVTPSELAAA